MGKRAFISGRNGGVNCEHKGKQWRTRDTGTLAPFQQWGLIKLRVWLRNCSAPGGSARGSLRTRGLWIHSMMSYYGFDSGSHNALRSIWEDWSQKRDPSRIRGFYDSFESLEMWLVIRLHSLQDHSRTSWPSRSFSLSLGQWVTVSLQSLWERSDGLIWNLYPIALHFSIVTSHHEQKTWVMRSQHKCVSVKASLVPSTPINKSYHTAMSSLAWWHQGWWEPEIPRPNSKSSVSKVTVCVPCEWPHTLPTFVS